MLVISEWSSVWRLLLFQTTTWSIFAVTVATKKRGRRRPDNDTSARWYHVLATVGQLHSPADWLNGAPKHTGSRLTCSSAAKGKEKHTHDLQPTDAAGKRNKVRRLCVNTRTPGGTVRARRTRWGSRGVQGGGGFAGGRRARGGHMSPLVN